MTRHGGGQPAGRGRLRLVDRAPDAALPGRGAAAGQGGGRSARSTAAGLDAGDVGLFVVCSCTGYATPGLDILLARDLGMAAGHPAAVRRPHGLLRGAARARRGRRLRRRPGPAGGAALRRADQPAHPAARPVDTQQIVSHALFSDAAAPPWCCARRPAGTRVREVAVGHRHLDRRPHDLGRHRPRLPDGAVAAGAATCSRGTSAAWSTACSARHGLDRRPRWTAGRCTRAARGSSTWCSEQLALPPERAGRVPGRPGRARQLLVADGAADPGPAAAGGRRRRTDGDAGLRPRPDPLRRAARTRRLTPRRPAAPLPGRLRPGPRQGRPPVRGARRSTVVAVLVGRRLVVAGSPHGRDSGRPVARRRAAGLAVVALVAGASAVAAGRAGRRPGAGGGRPGAGAAPTGAPPGGIDAGDGRVIEVPEADPAGRCCCARTRRDGCRRSGWRSLRRDRSQLSRPDPPGSGRRAPRRLGRALPAGWRAASAWTVTLPGQRRRRRSRPRPADCAGAAGAAAVAAVGRGHSTVRSAANGGPARPGTAARCPRSPAEPPGQPARRARSAR